MSVAQNGVRCCGYVFEHCAAAGKPLPASLIQPFCKTINHVSNEVKQLVPVVSTFLAKQCEGRDGQLLPAELLRPLLPMLVNGTKEKNSFVKSTSENALVSAMHMRTKGASKEKACLDLLDAGAKDSLQDVIGRVLNKLAGQPEGRDEVIDNTVLT